MVFIQGNNQQILIIYIEINKKKYFVNLAPVMVHKYQLFDNQIHQNSKTLRLISDFQLTRSNIDNVYS